MNNTICYVNQSAGYLDIDIIDDFVHEGQSVILYTGSNIDYGLLKSSVKIVTLKAYNKRNTYTRFLSWLIFTIQVVLRLLYRRKCHVFLVSNPPFTIFLPFILRLENYVLLIWDIYPDILIQYGFISYKSVIYKLWAKVNKSVFSRAKVIFTLGKGMKEVISTYSQDTNVVINPNWTDTSKFTPIDKKDNFFAKKHGIEENFVVMYSGNLGKTHDVEFIVDLAILLRNYDSFKFIIIGDGYKKDIIARRIHQNSLANCLLLPFQDFSVLPYSLSCADIAIVTLSPEVSKLSIPSKIYNLMAVGAAFLAITDEKSELASIIKDYNIGKSFNVNQLKLMEEFLLELKMNNELLTNFKTNSREASCNFTKNNAKKYFQLWFN